MPAVIGGEFIVQCASTGHLHLNNRLVVIDTISQRLKMKFQQNMLDIWATTKSNFLGQVKLSLLVGCGLLFKAFDG